MYMALYTDLIEMYRVIISFCVLESCEVGGHEYEHNDHFTHPTDPCQTCTCKVIMLQMNVACFTVNFMSRMVNQIVKELI